MGLLFTRASATFIYVLARFVYVYQRLAVLYYIYSQGNGTRNRSQRIPKKNKKKFLTNALDCAIIKMFQEEQKTK